MHTLYSTECIVLGSVDSGEASKYISLFTRDIGLVRAVAKSVREEKSKLRYSLQDFSCTYTTLVRGREIWRITGAKERYNIHNELKDEREKLFTITQILNLLQRLVHGEEKNEYLFDTLADGLEFAKENKMNKETLKNFEHLIVLRILYSLGYIAKKEQSKLLEARRLIVLKFDELLSSSDVTCKLLENASSMRKDIIFAINRALKEAHL